MELNDTDLRNNSYEERYDWLIQMFDAIEIKNIEIVPLVTGTKEKENTFKNLEHQNVEGIVLKLLSSPYQVGRPNSKGNQLKFKFWKSATCFVVSQKDDKRSVLLGVLDGKDTVEIGNVTIPANYEIPKPKTIVEIRYLYAYKGGSLYQPQYEGERKDMNKSDCKIEQLSYINGGK